MLSIGILAQSIHLTAIGILLDQQLSTIDEIVALYNSALAHCSPRAILNASIESAQSLVMLLHG